MPRPMTKYKTTKDPQSPEHSFIKIKSGEQAYAKYGHLATYSNKTQADYKVSQLQLLGYDCFRSFHWPFLIILS